MASKRDRIFAAFGASLFLITSSALTIIVIVLLVQQHNANKATIGSTSTPASSTKSTQSGDKMQNFTPTSIPQAKLELQDAVVGSGATVKSGDTITADYTGALMSDGTIFDASSKHGGPISFPLSGVIKGWSLGIPGMKVGGTRRLLIPADLAYGANSPGAGIPANADLVFDVTVTKIN